MNDDTWEWTWHLGRRERTRAPRGERLRDTLRRHAEADAARIAEGTQDAFLNTLHSLPVADWQDQYFKRRGKRR